MKRAVSAVASLIAATILAMSQADAFEANNVTITRVESFNSANHLWVEISANSNCGTGSAYFIIQRWDDQPEPTKTQRQLMYQMAMVAFSAGKKVRVVGSTCYLGQYLFADQVMLSD